MLMHRVPRWHGPKRRDSGLQVLAMRKAYPQFTSHGGEGEYRFRGPLQPQEEGEAYSVDIYYQAGQSPTVFVRKPELEDDPPHTYKDNSLCLYHPSVFRWHEGRLIARYIVPWTKAWLYFYEQWLDLGVWYGPEVPHSDGVPKEG